MPAYPCTAMLIQFSVKSLLLINSLFCLSNGRGVVMDVSAIASASTAMASAQVGNAVQVSVLKKAINIQAQGAMALLDALPQPALPPHLGQNINTVV